MAYVGNPIDTQNTFQSLVGKRFNGDGSTTAFTLDVAPSSTLDIEVFVGNVRQDPNSAYTLSGTTLTFTGAPPSGTNNIYVVHQAKSVGTIDVPDDIISGKTLVTLDNSNDHVLIEDATDGELKKALIPAASFAGIDDQTSSNDDQLTITDTAVVINEDSDDVDFRVESNGNANMLVVNAGGDRVGIGSDPDLGSGLHIKTSDTGASAAGGMDELVIENGSANAGLSILTATDGVARIAFGDSGDNAIGGIDYDHGSNYLRFNTSGSEQMRIASDGDISIGTTSNEAQLHVENNSATIDGGLYNCSSGSFSQNVLKLQCSRDTNNGSYGIIHARNGGGHVFNVDDGGNVVNSGNSYGALSDERIKQDIADASSQWDDIKALKIRKYKLKKLVNRDGDSAPTHLGVVAQELEASGMNGLVEENKPEKEDVALHSDFGTVVSGTADNGATPIYEKDEEGNDTDKITGYEDVFTAGKNKKQVKYSVLYMKSIKALQEAMTRIETLEAKVKTLEEA
jgi:hypothetical protein